SQLPPVFSDNSDLLLLLSSQAQFGGGKQLVNDQEVLVGAVIDELGFSVRADDEQRRHFALFDAARKLDIDLTTIVISIDRPPGRPIALNDIAIAALVHLRDEWCWWQRLCPTGPVFRVEPGHRWHVRLFPGAQFNQIGTSIGIDDQIGFYGRPRWLDHDMDSPGIAVTAFGVA